LIRAAFAALLFVLASSNASAQAQVPPVGATAEVRDPRGQLVATAALRQAPDQVLISLTFPNRTAVVGTHAIQIDAGGRCDFSSAAPTVTKLGSLVIGPAGVSVYNLPAPSVTVRELLQPPGASLVIFAQADDGAPIACGGITSAGANSRADLPNAIGIAAMGALLIAAGVVLRRPPA
jgi:Cu/Zn superoxide dismutase